MTLFFHMLLLFLLSGGSAKVVNNFEGCHDFFAGGKSPTKLSGPQYKQICQTLNGVPHFATYYDTDKRIPVYSAYKFAKTKECIRKNKWSIEPQLDHDKAGPNMASEETVDKDLRGKHQALDEDYEKSGYDRGHLAPVYHAGSQSCSDATFTLTNAAPQDPSFNRGPWRVLEENMAKKIKNLCLSKTLFIVTGVVPGTKTLNKRVNVPSYFWSAYCCLENPKKCQISGGFIGENKKNTPKTLEVDKLEKELAKYYSVSPFKVFYIPTEPKPSTKGKIITKKRKPTKKKHV